MAKRGAGVGRALTLLAVAALAACSGRGARGYDAATFSDSGAAIAPIADAGPAATPAAAAAHRPDGACESGARQRTDIFTAAVCDDDGRWVEETCPDDLLVVQVRKTPGRRKP